MKKTSNDYIQEASKVVKTYDVAESLTLLDDDAVVFIDVRDRNEIQDTGKIKGAINAPRGMLEFYIDPNTDFHMDIFAKDKKFIFYCGSGGRSVLAVQRAMEMGLSDVAQIGGGYKAWLKSGAPKE